MAESKQWWIIAFLPLGSPYTYKVFNGTKSEADAQSSLAVNGQVLGPYKSKADAEAAVKKQPQNPNAKPVIDVKNVISNVIPGAQQIGQFFSDLSSAQWWVRIGEIVVGLILIGVGVARITHAVPIATSIAKAVGTKGLA